MSTIASKIYLLFLFQTSTFYCRIYDQKAFIFQIYTKWRDSWDKRFEIRWKLQIELHIFFYFYKCISLYFGRKSTTVLQNIQTSYKQFSDFECLVLLLICIQSVSYCRTLTSIRKIAKQFVLPKLLCVAVILCFEYPEIRKFNKYIHF